MLVVEPRGGRGSKLPFTTTEFGELVVAPIAYNSSAVDVESFQSLSERYAKDVYTAYWHGTVIEGSHPQTFEG